MSETEAKVRAAAERVRKALEQMESALDELEPREKKWTTKEFQEAADAAVGLFSNEEQEAFRGLPVSYFARLAGGRPLFRLAEKEIRASDEDADLETLQAIVTKTLMEAAAHPLLWMAFEGVLQKGGRAGRDDMLSDFTSDIGTAFEWYEVPQPDEAFCSKLARRVFARMLRARREFKKD